MSQVMGPDALANVIEAAVETQPDINQALKFSSFQVFTFSRFYVFHFCSFFKISISHLFLNIFKFSSFQDFKLQFEHLNI